MSSKSEKKFEDLGGLGVARSDYTVLTLVHFGAGCPVLASI